MSSSTAVTTARATIDPALRAFVARVAEDAIKMYQEYVDLHDYDSERAVFAAIAEITDGHEASITEGCTGDDSYQINAAMLKARGGQE